MAHWLYYAGKSALQDADLLIPVPLHWYRLQSRLYNQSALLVKSLHTLANVPIAMILRRKQATKRQKGSKTSRIANLKNAFAIRKGICKTIATTKHLVMIDDVFTTGSTASACTRLLKKEGAKRIKVLTVD